MNKKYIPALKFDWLTRLFDPLMKLTKLEKRFKETLLLQANIKNNDIILDFGCGTGTLMLMAKNKFPKATMHGIDVDPKILKIAQNKVKNSNHELFLKSYDGGSLPYKNEMFNKVLSTLVFHHLTKKQKLMTLKEIYRVLKPGGELHIADFGKPKNIFMRIMFLFIQIFDGFANTSDNVKGLLPEIIKEAGFKKVVECIRMPTLVGSISFYKATKFL